MDTRGFQSHTDFSKTGGGHLGTCGLLSTPRKTSWNCIVEHDLITEAVLLRLAVIQITLVISC